MRLNSLTILKNRVMSASIPTISLCSPSSSNWMMVSNMSASFSHLRLNRPNLLKILSSLKSNCLGLGTCVASFCLVAWYSA